jgi:hypothetical protein
MPATTIETGSFADTLDSQIYHPYTVYDISGVLYDIYPYVIAGIAILAFVLIYASILLLKIIVSLINKKKEKIICRALFIRAFHITMAIFLANSIITCINTFALSGLLEINSLIFYIFLLVGIMTVPFSLIWLIVMMIYFLKKRFMNPQRHIVLPSMLIALLIAPSIAEQVADLRDGKTYKTTKIGTQTWLAENLNYNAKGSVCYENKPENCEKYGRLYDWDAAMDACPKGWHLPEYEEWQIIKSLEGTEGEWWSSTEYDDIQSWRFGILGNEVFKDRTDKNKGLSVRCVKDN